MDRKVIKGANNQRNAAEHARQRVTDGLRRTADALWQVVHFVRLSQVKNTGNYTGFINILPVINQLVESASNDFMNGGEMGGEMENFVKELTRFREGMTRWDELMTRRGNEFSEKMSRMGNRLVNNNGAVINGLQMGNEHVNNSGVFINGRRMGNQLDNIPRPVHDDPHSPEPGRPSKRPKSEYPPQTSARDNTTSSSTSDSRKEPYKLVCVVCHEEQDGISVDLVATVCGHICCDPCFKLCRRNSKNCPTCSRRLKDNQFHPLYL